MKLYVYTFSYQKIVTCLICELRYTPSFVLCIVCFSLFLHRSIIHSKEGAQNVSVITFSAHIDIQSNGC